MSSKSKSSTKLFSDISNITSSIQDLTSDFDEKEASQKFFTEHKIDFPQPILEFIKIRKEILEDVKSILVKFFKDINIKNVSIFPFFLFIRLAGERKMVSAVLYYDPTKPSLYAKIAEDKKLIHKKLSNGIVLNKRDIIIGLPSEEIIKLPIIENPIYFRHEESYNLSNSELLLPTYYNMKGEILKNDCEEKDLFSDEKLKQVNLDLELFKKIDIKKYEKCVRTVGNWAVVSSFKKNYEKFQKLRELILNNIRDNIKNYFPYTTDIDLVIFILYPVAISDSDKFYYVTGIIYLDSKTGQYFGKFGYISDGSIDKVYKDGYTFTSDDLITIKDFGTKTDNSYTIASVKNPIYKIANEDVFGIGPNRSKIEEKLKGKILVSDLDTVYYTSFGETIELMPEID